MTWSLLSKYGHVLVYVGDHPDARVRDIALALQVTERTAQHVVSELAEAGYISRERVGRRTRYSLRRELPLRDPQLVGYAVGDLLNGVRPDNRRHLVTKPRAPERSP